MNLPFAFFGFWGTTLLIGMAAASIPIIIHLLNRRRYQVVVWAAMRFLLNAQKQNTRRMRVEQLILLALRISLLVLLVIAMASIMPWAETVWAFVLPESAGFLKTPVGRTHRILVLDGSMSMAAHHGDGKSSFEHARKLASQIVQDGQPGDAFSVLVLKDRPEWVVGQVSYNTREVLKGIDRAQQAHGNAAMADALREVAEKLTKAGRGFKHSQVYFLTDMQKATWLPANLSGEAGKSNQEVIQKHLAEIKERAQTIFVDVHKDDPNNLAVTDLTIDSTLISTQRKVPITATIQHFGRTAPERLPVELLVGRAGDDPFKMNKISDTTVAVKAGEQITVPLEYTFPEPGTYAVQVRIGDDDLEPDNSRALVVTVKDTIPVLLVDGKEVKNRIVEVDGKVKKVAVSEDDAEKLKQQDPFTYTATEYLRWALNPVVDHPRLGRQFPVQPHVISADEFEKYTKDVDLAKYDAIFLCDVKGFTPKQVRRLQTHVRGGGGLIVSLGSTAAEGLTNYNEGLFRQESGLLPAKLLATQRVPTKLVDEQVVLDTTNYYFTPRARKVEDFQLPPLRAFANSDDRVALGHVLFWSYVQAAPVPDARTILVFAPQTGSAADPVKAKRLPADNPLLLEWNPPLPADAEIDPEQGPGKYRCPGKVILMTSTWNEDWTSWHWSPNYLPMVQEVLRLSLAGRLREHAGLVGEPLEEVLVSNGTTLDVELHLPDDSPARSLTTTGQGEVTVFRWRHTDLSGLYRMTVPGRPEYLFAVNVPATVPHHKETESDLTPVTKGELTRAYPNWSLQIVSDPRKAQRQLVAGNEDEETLQGKFGPRVAWILLLVVLALVLLEVVLACVFGHFAHVPGSAKARARFGAWPLVLAGVAGTAFLTFAVVLLHAAVTGDFLGFLPAAVRGWVEAWNGIAAAPAGETPKWEPVFSPFVPFLTDASLEWLLAGLLLVGMAVALIFLYRSEARHVPLGPKFLMGGLVLFLIFLLLFVLLPQFQVNIRRESWPELIVLIDDSLSMGVTDHYQDEAVAKAAARLGEDLKKRLRDELPEQISKLRQDVDSLIQARDPKQAGKLRARQKLLRQLEERLRQLDTSAWMPDRLQLAQALMRNDQQDWLQLMLENRKMKVHIYHLNASGKAEPLTKVGQGEPLEQAHEAVGQLQPHATESQLGTAVRQVLDDFGGSSVVGVVVLSDGNTTSAEDRSGFEKDLAEAAKNIARPKGVPLFLVGIGDDSELRDLRLDNLQVIDTVYVNDQVIFEAQVSGKGYKEDFSVEVVLKVREPDGGPEVEVDRKTIEIGPRRKLVPVQLKHVPTKAGEKQYIVEVIPPKEKDDKAADNPNLRLQRTILVQEAKPVRVLYVEGSPRYEYRFLKTLLEREKKDVKGNQSIELKVMLLDADPNIHDNDPTILKEADFPFHGKGLDQYQVVILGDVDPQSPKLGNQRLELLADFVQKKGGGLLVLAGPLSNPHAFRNTPLAKVLPVEPDPQPPQEPAAWTEGFRLELTAAGNFHPMFRLSPNQAENTAIWQKLAPMFWHAAGYKKRPGAEVLAVHPKAVGAAGAGSRLPMVVQRRIGDGRCMFFGFDETWRWRFRQHETYYNRFWIGAMRYLSPSRLQQTRLQLDRQTPYALGEKIKVTVRFPDNDPNSAKEGAPGAQDTRDNVKATVKYLPSNPNDIHDNDPKHLKLTKVEGSWDTYEGYYLPGRKGKYRFSLNGSEIKVFPPNKKDPSAEATVVLPPREMDKLQMNAENMEQAATATRGTFFTLANAHSLPAALPSGYRVLLNAEGEPWVVWNHPLLFLLALGLYSSLWILRKRHHLL